MLKNATGVRERLVSATPVAIVQMGLASPLNAALSPRGHCADAGTRRRSLTRHSAFKISYCSLPTVGKMTPPPGSMHFDFRMWSRYDGERPTYCALRAHSF